MQIKRFEAKNMTEALRQIKRELGSEAVILSAKDLRRENRLLGISRKIGVEVTAAVDEDAQAPKGVSANAAARTVSGRAAYAPAAMGAGNPLHVPKLVSSLYNRLNRTGTGPGMPAGASHGPRPDNTPRHAAAEGEDRGAAQAASLQAMPTGSGSAGMGRYLSQKGLGVAALRLDAERRNLVALVGNAGVGKTTTVAKLAALYACRHKERVGLLSLDGRRIGGPEQLQIYADSMGLPLALMRDADDGPRALEQLQDCRLVLVDCPAIDPGDKNGSARLQSELASLEAVTTLLTVSAGDREEDLLDTARRLAGLKPVGAVITKMDLSRSYADMMNFLCREGLAVYFYSQGPRVPFDLSRATIEGLTERFLQNGSPKTAQGASRTDLRPVTDADRTEASVYLANKSSDIFHRPGCKWIRLINQANIVEFTSFAEAVNHRFKPCRYCNPQHLSITGMLSRESAAR